MGGWLTLIGYVLTDRSGCIYQKGRLQRSMWEAVSFDIYVGSIWIVLHGYLLCYVVLFSCLQSSTLVLSSSSQHVQICLKDTRP